MHIDAVEIINVLSGNDPFLYSKKPSCIEERLSSRSVDIEVTIGDSFANSRNEVIATGSSEQNPKIRYAEHFKNYHNFIM